MSRRNEVYVMTTLRLQLEHHLGQTLVRHFIFDLFFVRLRNLIVLAIDAAQVAVAEKYVARAESADQWRLFTKVSSVRRDNRQTTRIACRDFVLQSIIETV